MNDYVSLIITAGLAATITVVGGIIKDALNDKRQRKNKKEDLSEEKFKKEHTQILTDMASLKNGLKFVLCQNILFLSEKYIAQGEITFEARKILHNMHHVYHNELNGNGDLDLTMKEINELPLSIKVIE